MWGHLRIPKRREHAPLKCQTRFLSVPRKAGGDRAAFGSAKPISKAYMQKAVGQIKQVIIEEYDEDICMYVGRAESQAPEVDGVTYISSPVPLILGQIVPCKIVQANEYDWMGEAINDVSQ